jgi:hypothetical protein
MKWLSAQLCYERELQDVYEAMLELETYPTKPEVAEYTSSFASHYTPVLDLCVSCVAVHLCELDLGLRADTLWEGRVANEVSESLPNYIISLDGWPCVVSATEWSTLWYFEKKRVPLWLVLGEDLPFCVIANIADVDVTAKIELLCAEL